MFTLSLSNEASAAFAKMPDRVRSALSKKASSLAAELEGRVQQKLAGGVLNVRSGALARAIVSSITDASGYISVAVAAAGDVKYAAIHEFGGVIPPREIVPEKAKALAFLIGGKQALAERANIPAVTMPERSYLRASLGELADDIRAGLSEAVAEAMK
jgi:phage gpG-like protein